MSEPAYYGSTLPVAPGDIQAEAVDLIDRFVEANAGGGERLIPLLHLLQERLGHLSFPVQEYVAEKLALSPIEVFSVLSFYHFFTLKPRGRFPLKVCMGTACFVRHAAGLLDTIEDALKITVGETSPDGLFSLEQVRCLGACGLAPAMMVGHDVHGNLDPKQARRLITQLRARGRRETNASKGASA